MTNPTSTRSNGSKMLRRYGPFGLVIVVVAVIALVTVVFSGGDDDEASDGAEVKSKEELIRSGPMTPEKAELLGKTTVDFGPNCDLETGRIKVPTVYAPPCVEPFTGKNGGTTSQGVTEDTIKIVAYQADPAKDPLLSSQINAAGADTSPESAIATGQGYVDYYNEYFETYGRDVEVEFFTGSGAFNDEEAAKADAIAIAEKEPFAVLNGPAQVSRVFADELAARGILCVGRCALAIPEAFTKERAPYLWAIGPSPEEASRLAAEMIGNYAPPGPAQFAGDPELQGKDRVYGAIHFETRDVAQKEAFGTFKNELKKNGVDVTVDVPYDGDEFLAKAQENARTAITKLKEGGATTVIFYGDPITPGPMTKEATAQEFFPEWILGPSVLADTSVFARSFDQDQWKNGFGISLIGGRGEQELQDSYRIYQWFHGTPPPNNTYGVIAPDYGILFRGIHLAGPKLTPETFRDGLFRFPPTGGEVMNPSISYGNHGIWPYTDLWGTDDAALVWWDPTAVGESEIGQSGNGLYRYANNGARYKLGEWPKTAEEAGLHDDAASVTIYTEIPPEAAAPDYPSPAG